MFENVLALLGTVGWIVVVGVILRLFGTTEGGAWSIVGGVARGVRSWAGSHRPSSAAGPPVSARPRSALVADRPQDRPEIEELDGGTS